MLDEHLYHYAIAGLPRGAVRVFVTSHTPAYMGNGNIRSDEFDVCTGDRPHALFKLHGMRPCLQRLELRATLEHLSGHIYEADVFGDQGAQCLNVIPVPGIVPARLDIPYRGFIS